MPRACVSPSFLLPVLAAPFAGSFLGVLVRRLPEGRPVALDRSRCESCGHALGPAELVPIVSYVWQRGRCRHCGAAIGRFHLVFELSALLVAAWAAAAVEPELGWLWADCVFGWMLLALAWIDWTHLRLPDVLTLPLLLAGLGATALLDPDDATDHALAAAIGYAALRLVSFGYLKLRGREGLGAGDAKLLAAAGAWLGLAGLGPVLLLACLGGLAVALGRGGLRATTVIPLGTCLAGAAWLVRLYGQ